MYRGYHSEKPYIIKDCPQSRFPKDSSMGLHDFLNMCITRAKRVANRSNSLFCSGEVGVAGCYGNIHAIFPIGKFNYTWIDGVHDAYQLGRDYGKAADISMGFLKRDTDYRSFGQWASNYDGYYKEKNKGPLSPYSDTFNTQAVLNFISKIHGNDQSLKIAMDRGNEVMLSAPKFLLIHNDYFEQFGIDIYAS